MTPKETLKTISKIGSFVALSPAQTENASLFSLNKLYVFSIISFYLIVSIVVIFFRIIFFNSVTNLIQIFLQFAKTLVACLITLYFFISSASVDRKSWRKLIDRIHKVKSPTKEKSYFSFYLSAHLLFALLSIASIYFLKAIEKLEFTIICVIITRYFEIYSQYYYLLSMNAILKILLQKYNQQITFIKNVFKNHQFLEKKLLTLKFNIYTLRTSCNAFNKVFGWKFFFIILFSSLKLLTYLHLTITIPIAENSFKSLTAFEYAYILLFWVS